MKVTHKIFVVALLLFMIMSVGTAVAQDDSSLSKGDLDMASVEANEETDSLSAGIETALEEASQSGGLDNQLSDTTPEANFSSIQDAIDHAGDGDTIYLNGSTYTGSEQINIGEVKNDIVIIGGSKDNPGLIATLDAGGANRILNIEANNIVIKGIKFINGNTTQSGGAINWRGANATLENSIFANNVAGINGGALVLNSGNAIISNCSFINNTAKRNGAAVVYGNNNTLTNIAFENNRVTEYTAALSIMTGSANKVSGLRFINNSAGEGNGAMAISTFNSTLTNLTFENNHAQKEGSALTIDSGAVGTELSDSYFINNTGKSLIHWNANNATIKNVHIFGGNGTAVYLHANDAQISDVELIGQNGTGFYIEGNGNKMDNVGVIDGQGTVVEMNGIDYVIDDFNVVNRTDGKVFINGGENYDVIKFTPSVEYTVDVKGVDVNITLKTDGEGYVFFTLNGVVHNQTISNGTANFTLSNINPGNYLIDVTVVGFGKWTNATQPVSFTVDKHQTSISALDATLSIVYGGIYTATFASELAGQNATLTVEGKTYSALIDSSGKATFQLTPAMLGSAATKVITVNLISDYYTAPPATAKLTVLKENSKISVKKAVKFKKSKKTKKIKATLKDSRGNAVKNVPVTLKITAKKVKGKKSFKFKTNSKGVVTFKISKKTKFSKGTFKATVQFSGNGNYNKATKTVKIVIK